MKKHTYKAVKVIAVTGHRNSFLGAFEKEEAVLPEVEQTEICSAVKKIAEMDPYGEWHYGAVAV